MKNGPEITQSHISAERTRFELVIRLPVCRFSKPVDSATLPPLQSIRKWYCEPNFSKWIAKITQFFYSLSFFAGNVH